MKNKIPSSKTTMNLFDNTPSQKSFAEVIESSLDSFIGQCWAWDYFPYFGSLVQVENNTHCIFGCISQVQTGSMDSTRSAFPYQKTEEELRAEQPQIFEFLKTSFTVQILGYTEKPVSMQKPSFFYLTPPTPTKIHSFITECSKEVSLQFFSSPQFLHLLFAYGAKITNLDELLLAILHRLNKQQPLTQDFLDAFCQSFSLLTNNDYRRLKLFLKRMETLL